MAEYRQLIYKKAYRVIYRFDPDEQCVRILNLSICRQKLPRRQELDRDSEDAASGLPLE